jgi:hypothetical protein
MSLTISEIGLLRSLVQWRRANGWTREYRLWDLEQHDHTYEHKDSGLSVEATMHRIELIPGEPKVVYEVGVEACGHLLFHGWPWSVRSAVNGIAAAEVIPPEMALWSNLVDLERWVLVAIEHAPKTCWHHGEDFGRLGWEYGLPRCDSCKQPYMVSKLRDALERVPDAV